MLVAMLATSYMDWMYKFYEQVHPSVAKLFTDERLVLPLSALMLVVMSAIVGWSAKTVAAGHRNEVLRRIKREEGNMRIARQRAMEDAILTAVESLVYKNQMSAHTALNWYREFAAKMGLDGLLVPAKARKKLHTYRKALLREERFKRSTESLAALKAAQVLPFPIDKGVSPSKSVERCKSRKAA